MKRYAALLWILALCVGLLLYSFAQKPEEPVLPPATEPSAQVTEPSAATDPSAEPSVEPTTQATETPPEATEPSTEPTEPAPQVRIWDNDPSLRDAWAKIGGDFTAKTGIEVILTDNQEAATLLTLTKDGLAADRCADLSGSAAYAQLSSWDLALSQGDRVYAIAAEVECFALICNETLMAQGAHTRSDITNFATLTTVAQNLSAAGLTPFAGLEFNGPFTARLASLSGDLRGLMDLWIANCSPTPPESALQQFLDGGAVFYLGSTDEYEAMSALGAQNLSILPLYLGSGEEQSQSLCAAAKRYWAVSGTAEPRDTQATIDFLNFLVTADGDNPPPVDTLQLLSPYRQAAYAANPLEQVLREDVRSGKTIIACDYLTEPPAGLPEALTVYAGDPTDENWAAIEAILTQ